MPSRIRLRPRGTPPTPEADSETLFLDVADGALKSIDSTGTVTTVGDGAPGGGAISADNTVDTPEDVTSFIVPGAVISGGVADLTALQQVKLLGPTSLSIGFDALSGVSDFTIPAGALIIKASAVCTDVGNLTPVQGTGLTIYVEDLAGDNGRVIVEYDLYNSFILPSSAVQVEPDFSLWAFNAASRSNIVISKTGQTITECRLKLAIVPSTGVTGNATFELSALIAEPA